MKVYFRKGIHTHTQSMLLKSIRGMELFHKTALLVVDMRKKLPEASGSSQQNAKQVPEHSTRKENRQLQ